MRPLSAQSSFREDLEEVVREQWEYRDLLFQLTRRDLVLRYKQAVMGFAWAVLVPLTNTAVFSILFTRIAPLDVGVPYPLFAFLGLLTWNFTASALRFSVISLSSNANLVTKVYCPREVFPLSAVLVALVDTLVAATLLVVLMGYFRVWPGLAALYLPVVVAVHIMFTIAVALVLAMANLFFRDVKYLFEVAITLWMFSTSVLYPSNVIGGTAGLAIRMNPMTAIIDAYRDALLLGRSPLTRDFALAAAVSALFLLFVAVLFHRVEFKFAEIA